MSGSNPLWRPGTRYSFIIGGELSDRVLAAFPELTVSGTPRESTTLLGSVGDPTELRSLLARFDALGLTVLEMVRCDE